MIQHNSSQQLDLNTMGKSQNISIHHKSNSSSLPAAFANNYASNSQRLNKNNNGTSVDKYLYQKSLMDQASAANDNH